jgi:hypothetical protein
MTAEIAILNKHAVALAADSAVTVGAREAPKTYNTANKLFALSKHEPAGVMVYGSAELMGIPWETIVKVFRGSLGRKRFGTLKEYAESFMSFLEHEGGLFPESEQEKFLHETTLSYLCLMKEEIDEAVREKLESKKVITELEIERLIAEAVERHFKQWNEPARLPTIPDGQAEGILEKYGESIAGDIGKVMQKLPLSSTILNQLKQICASLFVKNRFPDSISGVVVAGFGAEDVFSSLFTYSIDGMVNNHLKYRTEDDKSGAITFEQTAWIVPFAQSEMVITFMEGIDPHFRGTFVGGIAELLTEKYPSTVVESIPNLTAADKNELRHRLTQTGKGILDEFNTALSRYCKERHISPITAAVQVLPKDELAAMAESLVNLTSFKRRISMDAETVGGPVDVAVISKGDGFVWIKRKHYFKPELNTNFFMNYREETRQSQEEPDDKKERKT